MRKEKLFALALAGILAVSSAPAVFAAEADPTGVEEGINGQDDSESQEEEEPEEKEEAEQDNEENNEETEENETNSPSENPQDENASSAPTSGNPTPSVPVVPKAASASNGTIVQANSMETLKNAITTISQTADKKGEIQLTGNIELAETVVIPEGVQITVGAVSKDATIKRAANFKADMFEVKGSLTLGKITVAENTSEAALVLDGTLKDGDKVTSATGSILKVNGTLQIESTVKLTGNTTSAKGAAVHNTGKLILNGGTITGNVSDNGAIYSEKEIEVSGSPKVKDNKKADGIDSNIELKAGVSIKIVGELKDAVLNFHFDKASAGLKAVTSENSLLLNEALEKNYIHYEEQNFILNESGVLEEKPRTPYVADIENCTFEGIKDSYKEGETATFTVVGDGMDITDEEAVEGDTRWKPLKYGNANFEDGVYTLEMPMPTDIDFEGASHKSYSLTVTFVYQKFVNGVWEDVKENGQSVTKEKKASFKVVKGEEAGLPTPVDKKDCKITGLSSSYKKGTTMKFKAVGAGMDNDNPQEGDTRWVPLKYGVQGLGQTNFEIEDGEYNASIPTSTYTVGKEYDVYATFQEQTYVNGEWVDVKDSTYRIDKSVKITSASSSSSSSNKSSSKKKATATPKSSTKKASNTKTGDESPVLPLTVLCMASLATGGYVLVRRRKKSEN